MSNDLLLVLNALPITKLSAQYIILIENMTQDMRTAVGILRGSARFHSAKVVGVTIDLTAIGLETP